MFHRFTVELVELLVYKCKSQKRSFNDQLTVKPSISGKYIYPYE